MTETTDSGDDSTADRHADLDVGEYGGMADSDYYDRIAVATPDTTPRCSSCGHRSAACDGVECDWCPEGYCEDMAGNLKAENDAAADPPEREA